MKVSLRDYQARAFDLARDAVRQGHKRILIVAPTGGGKTVLASALMEMVKEKGNRAAFVVDRLSLIQQTSDTFDRYGLDHGVIQGGHVRFRPSMPLQLCSVQTLARRRWPETQVDVFDEAHVLHACHKARLQQDESVVIGLTATPFTKGLGKWFDVVINVTTTRELIDQKWLSPYRVFSCVEPDMSGVAVKSTGEWDDTQASKKALEVVGDVVAEYLKHGESRKFICSAVDTTHVEELQRQFLAAGINVASYTYKDKDEDRADVTLEFRKPDSSIRGLITVTAASRGFDVPDVGCIIMARPLRKSWAAAFASRTTRRTAWCCATQGTWPGFGLTPKSSSTTA
jgi:superfamily II DNA or RNA helicase